MEGENAVERTNSELTAEQAREELRGKLDFTVLGLLREPIFAVGND
ncbi:MAG: hypothetical protein WBI44_06995 [Syntrophaceticus sp.]